jgi:hypothetical protein
MVVDYTKDYKGTNLSQFGIGCANEEAYLNELVVN